MKKARHAVCAYNPSSGRAESSQSSPASYEPLVQRPCLTAATGRAICSHKYGKEIVIHQNPNNKDSTVQFSTVQFLVAQVCNPNIWAVEAQELDHSYL